MRVTPSTPVGAVTVVHEATRLVLLPERALWLPDRQSLLVADIHFGKASSFRRLGVPVPETTTQDNLQRLDALIDLLAIEHVVFLGDFLHSRLGRTPSTLAAVGAWRRQRASISLTLVRGNHDDRAGDPPADFHVACVDEPHTMPGAPGLALCHHPQSMSGHLVVAGHEHPCVHIGRGFERVRLPCFHHRRDQGLLVLPAFGAFTGMHPIARAPGDAVHAVSPTAVVSLG